jgi:hypothetical protein
VLSVAHGLCLALPATAHERCLGIARAIPSSTAATAPGIPRAMPWYTTGSALLYHGRCARSLMRGSLLYQRQPLVDHGRCLHRPQRLPLLYNGLCLDRPRRQPPVDDGRWLGRPRAVPCSTTGVALGRSLSLTGNALGRSWAVPCSTSGSPWSITGIALLYHGRCARSITVAHGRILPLPASSPSRSRAMP